VNAAIKTRRDNKVEKTKLYRAVRAFVLVAMLACIAVALVACSTTGKDSGSSVKAPVSSASGNTSASSPSSNSTTYRALTDFENKTARIIRIDDADDAKVQELYRSSFSDYDIGFISLWPLEDDALYFREYFEKIVRGETSGEILAIENTSSFKMLDLSSEDNQPATMQMSFKQGTTIPRQFVTAFRDAYNRDLTPYDLGFSRRIGSYSYAILANSFMYDKVLLFQLDWDSFEVECFEGAPLDMSGFWRTLRTDEDYVYFQIHNEVGTQGLYRADLYGFERECLITKEALGEATVGFFRVKDNFAFYSLHGYSWDLRRLDMSTKEEAVILTAGIESLHYTVADDRVFYFQNGDLRSCNHDGSDNRLLIKNNEDDRYISDMFISDSGLWIYYVQDGKLYRVSPDATSLPTESLDMPI